LRIYVTNLEEIYELYNIEKNILILKNIEIGNLRTQNNGKDSTISILRDMVSYRDSQLEKADKNVETQKALALKYKKRASQWPRWFGAGGVCGIILCLVLNK